jgi:ABC-type transport system involved in cytochrome bd biosynthesis fused ATPase/permease subunit
MRISNDRNRAQRPWNPANAEPPPVASTDRDSALDLARKLGSAGMRAVLVGQTARTLFRIGFSGALALFAGLLIEAGRFDLIALAGALGGLALSSSASVFTDLRAANTENFVTNGLRIALQEALLQRSPTRLRTKPGGALVAGLQRYPNALASLVISHRAAKSMLSIGPFLAAVAVAAVSWQAALTLIFSIPIMIVFFVALGGVIRGKAELQERAFGRLAAQFSDRIRTLPTILANHALQREHGKIEQRMTFYANSTMAVLKVAFLNAGIIDFFSALAIAVLAVFLGLGHLGLVQIPGFSNLALWQSLFILMIAAEFFVPFRRYAEQYHIQAEGEAAAKELDWYFDDSDATASDPGNVMIRPYTVAGAFDGTDFPTAGLIAISGPSGSGKSTLLRRLAGIETSSRGLNSLPQVMAEGCDWISTDIYVPAGTLAEAIGWNRKLGTGVELQEAAMQVGLLNERLLPGGLNARIAEGGDNLSGGQRMRIGIARIMLSSGVIVADEPTAKLDPETAKLVRRILANVAKRRLVIVATHDQQLIEAASQHHVLWLQSQAEHAAA